MKQYEAQPGVRVTWDEPLEDGSWLHGTVENSFNYPHLPMLPEYVLVKWDDDPINVCVTPVNNLRVAS